MADSVVHKPTGKYVYVRASIYTRIQRTMLLPHICLYKSMERREQGKKALVIPFWTLSQLVSCNPLTAGTEGRWTGQVWNVLIDRILFIIHWERCTAYQQERSGLNFLKELLHGKGSK